MEPFNITVNLDAVLNARSSWLVIAERVNGGCSDGHS